MHVKPFNLLNSLTNPPTLSLTVHFLPFPIHHLAAIFIVRGIIFPPIPWRFIWPLPFIGVFVCSDPIFVLRVAISTVDEFSDLVNLQLIAKGDKVASPGHTEAVRCIPVTCSVRNIVFVLQVLSRGHDNVRNLLAALFYQLPQFWVAPL